MPYDTPIAYQTTHDALGYVFEADMHCPDCVAENRPELLADDAIDNEGNPVGAVAPWDDTFYECLDCDGWLPYACGDCLESLDGVAEDHGLEPCSCE